MCKTLASLIHNARLAHSLPGKWAETRDWAKEQSVLHSTSKNNVSKALFNRVRLSPLAILWLDDQLPRRFLKINYHLLNYTAHKYLQPPCDPHLNPSTSLFSTEKKWVDAKTTELTWGSSSLHHHHTAGFYRMSASKVVLIPTDKEWPGFTEGADKPPHLVLLVPYRSLSCQLYNSRNWTILSNTTELTFSILDPSSFTSRFTNVL